MFSVKIGEKYILNDMFTYHAIDTYIETTCIGKVI